MSRPLDNLIASVRQRNDDPHGVMPALGTGSPVKIHVIDYNRQDPYHPGATFYGSVTYTTRKRIELQDATIHFSGKMETVWKDNQKNTRKMSNDIRVFDLTHQLFKGPFHVSPQTFVWPFEFTIPRTFKHRPDKYVRPAGLADDGMMLLTIPPSYYFQHGTFRSTATSSIKYKLYVKVQVAGLWQDEELEMIIPIRRGRDYRPPLPELAEHRVMPYPSWRSRKLTGQKLSFSQSLRKTFTEASDLQPPGVAFDASIMFPRRLAASQRAILSLAIRRRKLTDLDPESPTLRLQSMSLTLIGNTWSVVPRSTITGPIVSEDKKEEAFHKVEFEPRVLDLNGSPTLVSSDLKIEDWKRLQVQELLGDFHMPIIRYKHSIQVQMAVVHEESGHVFDVRTEFPMQLLDPYRARLEDHAAAEPVHRAHQDYDEDLPAYDADVVPPGADSDPDR